jgi:hypothetical protein
VQHNGIAYRRLRLFPNIDIISQYTEIYPLFGKFPTTSRLVARIEHESWSIPAPVAKVPKGGEPINAGNQACNCDAMFFVHFLPFQPHKSCRTFELRKSGVWSMMVFWAAGGGLPSRRWDYLLL